jgi:hypothetical protein
MDSLVIIKVYFMRLIYLSLRAIEQGERCGNPIALQITDCLVDYFVRFSETSDVPRND